MIRLAYSEGGYTQKQLGDQFGISHQTVSKIVRGQSRSSNRGPIQTKDCRYIAADRDISTGQFVGKAKAGRLLDGRTWDEMPEVKL